jgi:PAS domain S-box-containing protein
MKASESPQNDESAATENALRRAVDTTPAFIHTARPDGYLDYFNRGWLDFLGKSLEDVCGWRWTESVHPEDVAALVQKWRAALASGEPVESFYAMAGCYNGDPEVKEGHRHGVDFTFHGPPFVIGEIAYRWNYRPGRQAH